MAFTHNPVYPYNPGNPLTRAQGCLYNVHSHFGSLPNEPCCPHCSQSFSFAFSVCLSVCLSVSVCLSLSLWLPLTLSTLYYYTIQLIYPMMQDII
ncbi:unnamed protein product [Arctogadus glacialis]